MEQDYDKIFASNASSFQEWEDENYLKGWGFLGQTPPPYQLFDSLFKRLDLKTQELKSGQDNISSNYVPLAGGIMTGLLSLFTGSTVPTPSKDDNSQKIVNSEWVQTWVKALVAELSENIEVQWSGSTFTVPALGITGLMAQNGYICLGKLFGGLILQWGTSNIVNIGNGNAENNLAFNINYKQRTFDCLVCIKNRNKTDGIIVVHVVSTTLTTLNFLIDTYTTNSMLDFGTCNVSYFVIGI